ncbi:MAG: protein kinase [Planctomycetes bacterium]|nr:protein kinase [Planctomycetota bacterium]
MPPHASPALLELLTRLGLCTSADVASMAARVRRLTRTLPDFDQAWVDALAQARILTAYQAGEINAGRAEQLAVGPYIIEQPLDSLGYATVFRARLRATPNTPLARVSHWRRTLRRVGLIRQTPCTRVRLAVIDAASAQAEPSLVANLEELRERSRRVKSPYVAPIRTVGRAGGQLWAAADYRNDMTAAERLTRFGRFDPTAVLIIARQMAAALAACSPAGIVHGDVSARTLLIGADGRTQLAFPGLRQLVRPHETERCETLGPEVFDYLSPQRAADAPAAESDDYFSAALVWWHLLAGRAPRAAATAQEKLHAARSLKIPNITHLASDIPAALLSALRTCCEQSPMARPTSAAAIEQKLGPPPRRCERTLARALDQPGARRLQWGSTPAPRRWSRSAWRAGAIAAGCMLMIVAGTWPQWQPLVTRKLAEEVAPTIKIAAPTVAATPAPLPKPITPTAPPTANGPWPSSTWENGELVLAPGEPIAVEQFKLTGPTTIRSRLGQRATIAAPQAGWRLSGAEVRFENIDFVADAKNLNDPLIRLDVRRVEFVGCSWQHQRQSTGPALVWNPPAGGGRDDDVLLRGELHLADCLLQHIGSAIHYDGRGSALVELANVLHLGPGALVQLDSAPQRGQLLELTASHVTLREAAGLLTVNCNAIPTDPGQFLIVTDDCVLCPSTGVGLLNFVGVEQPAALLQAVAWRGQGSVMPQHATLCLWRDGEGTARGADDEKLQAAGLVRSPLDFSGEKSAGPAANRVVRWQAPRQSPEPPGIRETKPMPSGALR